MGDGVLVCVGVNVGVGVCVGVGSGALAGVILGKALGDGSGGGVGVITTTAGIIGVSSSSLFIRFEELTNTIMIPVLTITIKAARILSKRS